MKAAVIEAYGQSPVVRDHEEPPPAEGQEPVEIELAGINPVDLAIASGTFDAGSPPLPYVPGLEGVGKTAEGKRVWFGSAVFPFGSMADRAPITAGSGFDLPAEISAEAAIPLGVAGMAAWLSLGWRGGLKEGESVLVLGASGSVGQIAIQAARLMGAGKVIGAARSSSGREKVEALGADAVIDTEPENLTERIQEAGGGGVDLIIDNLWGEPAAAALAAVNMNGRLVQVGNSAGRDSTIRAGQMRGSLAGILAHRNVHAPVEVQRRAFADLCRHSITGEIRIEVETIPLEEAAEAWRRQGASPGHKLALRI